MSKELLLENTMLASNIAETLKEKEIELISSIVTIKGSDFSLNIVTQVKEILQNGGSLKKNGEPRTPGGIFFMLTKQQLTKEEEAQIFRPIIVARRKQVRARRKILKKLTNLSL